MSGYGGIASSLKDLKKDLKKALRGGTSSYELVSMGSNLLGLTSWGMSNRLFWCQYKFVPAINTFKSSYFGNFELVIR